MERCFLIVVAVLLTACAQQPVRDIAPRPQRVAIDAYSLEGRVAVKRGNASRQASIAWQHATTRDEIELGGPLGQQAARLTRDAEGARLQTSSREIVTAPDWGSLAEQVLGVALPLDSIGQWIVGNLAVSDSVTRDAVGRPQQAKANGWQIDYLAYESEAADALPTLIQMRRDDIEVKLKVGQWELN